MAKKNNPWILFTLWALGLAALLFAVQAGLFGVQVNRFDVEWYGGLVALIFAGVGLLWWRLHPRVVEKSVVVEKIVLPEPTGKKPGELTDREWEILLALSHGKRNREIAEALFVSENTVKTHLLNLYAKLNATNRTQAVAEARKLGWV